MKINLTDAKTRLPQLIRQVESGSSVTICRCGVPVVDLVPSKKRVREEPQFGTLKGRVVIHDPDWWKPMMAEDLGFS